jgi:hypothetical protein
MSEERLSTVLCTSLCRRSDSRREMREVFVEESGVPSLLWKARRRSGASRIRRTLGLLLSWLFGRMLAEGQGPATAKDSIAFVIISFVWCRLVEVSLKSRVSLRAPGLL